MAPFHSFRRIGIAAFPIGRKDNSPKRPKWPNWGKGKWIVPWVGALFEWLGQWLLYVSDVTCLGRFADAIAKYSTFAVVIFSLYAFGHDLWDADKIAATKEWEELRTNFEMLGPDSEESALARKRAFRSYLNHLNGASPAEIVQELIDLRADARRRQFSRLNLSGLNLSGEVLDDKVFRAANLQNADFTDASLCKADLSDTDLINSHFNGAQLDGADLSKARLSRCIFRGADLTGANCSNAVFWDYERAANGGFISRSAEFDKSSKLNGVILRGAKMCHVDFAGVDLSDADLRGALLVRQPSSGPYPERNAAGFRDASLRRAKLQGVNFAGVDLTNADLFGAELAGADLTNAVGVSRKQFESAISDSSTKPPSAFIEDSD